MNSPINSPLIGITTYHRDEAGAFHLPGAYVDAVQLAGGIPVLLPPNPVDPTHVLDKLDGLVLTGGGDIDPAFYDGSSHPTVYLVDAERDTFELALTKAALNYTIPVLGICRGMQVLNVATGGDLVVHVPEQYGDRIAHRLDQPRRPIEHPVQIDPQARLATFLGATTIEVVSWHHQAVKTIDPVWRIVASAADGLVEAMEHQQHPWMIGVQWHPELSLNNPPHQQLFQALVKAALVKGSIEIGKSMAS